MVAPYAEPREMKERWPPPAFPIVVGVVLWWTLFASSCGLN
jgi:hypothetical protein